jgi:aminopeptidase
VDNASLAKKLVNYTERIGQKENPGIAKAVKRWGGKARALLSKDGVSLAAADKLGATRMLDEWCGVDYGPLAIKEKSAYRFKKKVGHTVRVLYNPANRELAQKVAEECWRNGAHTLMQENTVKAARTRRLITPIDSLREFPPLSRAIEETLDYVIHIDSLERENWKQGIPVNRFLASAPASMRVHEIQDRVQTRWVFVGWPHPGIAKDLGITPASFKRILDNSIALSYKKETFDLVWGYYRALKGTKEIRVTHEDGTDLSFSVKGRKFLCDDAVLSDEDIAGKDVGMNIPCGEIFTAPVETSANGVLKIPRNITPGHGLAEGIRFVFKNGKVVEYSAEKNEKALDKTFEESSGDARRIAELGIGCNRGAEYTNGYTLIDEKILGTIHIAIGWNLGYGGRNNSNLHLDFIRPMRGGVLYADGKPVMVDGRIVK